jgi:hypothetical protein
VTAAPGAGPVFVGGLDRTGKTTIAALLTSHPAFAVPGAGSNMWTYFYRRYGDLAVRANFERCLEAMLRYEHVRMLGCDPGRIRREFADGPATYARLFALFCEHFAERSGKPRWGVQTGLVERYADELFAAYDGVRMIHMLRDPRDRYEAARRRSPDGRGGAGGAVARWRYSLRLAERNLGRHHDRYLVVRYEDLVGRTEPTLRGVCAFLGEPFAPEMLRMAGAPERRARLAARAGATGDGPLTTAFVGSFRGRVGPRELAFLQLHTGGAMRAYGYHPDPVGLTPAQWARFAALDWPGQAARMVAWRAVEALGQRLPALAGQAVPR